MPIISIARLFFKALLSMLTKPHRIDGRPFRAELVCRFLRFLLNESKAQPEQQTTKEILGRQRHESILTFRQRQDSLIMYSPALSKVNFENTIIDGVKCQWCTPKERKVDRCIVYFHGGGYVVGNVDGYHTTMAQLALDCDARVLGVDYRLGPEHLFPSAQDDCAKVSAAILSSEEHVFLAGDSAGGALAIASAIYLRDSTNDADNTGNNKKITALILISPWVAPGSTTKSMSTMAQYDIFDSDIINTWATLTMSDQQMQDPRVNFSNADLKGLPPIYIQAAETEILIDQINEFATQSEAAGNETFIDIFPAQFHVFQTFTPLVPGAREALESIGRFVKNF